MKLIQLKKILKDLKEILERFSNDEKSVSVIEKDLLAKFNVTGLDKLPKKVKSAYNRYKKSVFEITALCRRIEFFINDSEKKGKKDDDEINYGDEKTSENKMQEIVSCYELISRRYADFKVSLEHENKKHKFQNELIFDDRNQRHINLSTDDFSDEFLDRFRMPILNILEVLTGDIDLGNINKKFTNELILNSVEPSLLHANFGKDSYATFFDRQTVYAPERSSNTPLQHKKVDDFIRLYFEKSKISSEQQELLKPNLKILLSTLSYQGSIGFAACAAFQGFFSMHGVNIVNFGKDYRNYFYFDDNNNLKIKYISDQNKYGMENGQEINVNSIIQVEFTIAMKIINNSPHFELSDTLVTCSFTTPQEKLMTVASNLLKNPNKVSKDKFDVLPSCVEYLSKYLGYSSLEDFYVSKGGKLNCPGDRDVFNAINLFSFLQMACVESTKGRKISEFERDFFEKMSSQYKDKKLNSLQISQEICKFVENVLKNNKINEEDKVSYIYWLQLAGEITEDKNIHDKIHSFYEILVQKTMDTQINRLMELASEDSRLYQEMANPSSIFYKKPKLPDRFHAEMLGKYSFLFEGSQSGYFAKLLNNLNSEDKLLFLVKFSSGGGDIVSLDAFFKGFLNKKFIEDLTKAIKTGNKNILNYLNDLVANLPASSVSYIRASCEKLFSAYIEEILKQSPNEILDFLLKNRDKCVYQKFGMDFLNKFSNKLFEFSSSDDVDKFSVVPAIAIELVKMLNSDPEFIKSNHREDFLIFLNEPTKRARERLHCLPKKEVEEESEKEYEKESEDEYDKESEDELEEEFEQKSFRLTTDKDEIESLLEKAEKEEKFLEENEKKAEYSVKKFEEVKEKSTSIKIEREKEKDIIPSSSSSSGTKGIKY